MKLRALEPEDINFLYRLENQEALWEVSDTQLPFAKHLLRDYLRNAKQDIYEAKQYRYAISLDDGSALGCIDLYDFSPKHKRATVGIALLEEHQGKGYGAKALTMLIRQSRLHLDLHQLIAYIPIDNAVSIYLFERAGFVQSGTLKDWIYTQGAYKDVSIYQLLF